MQRGPLSVLLACVFGLPSPLAAREGSEEEVQRAPTPTILSLVSGEPALPWTDQITRGFVDTIESRQEGVSLHFEYLDSVRFDAPGYVENLRDWLRLKYADRAVDLIVLRGQDAVAFMVRSGPEEWRGIPMLSTELGGIPDAFGSLPNMSGIFLESHSQAALSTVRQILPETERVAFFYGATDIESSRYSGFAKQVRAAGLTPLDLGGLAMDRLLAQVGRLPGRTAIFYFPVQIDGEGKAFTTEAACELVSKAANRPMFSLYRMNLGCGVVGGLMLDFEVWGQALAERALELVEAPSLPTVTVPVERHARLAFDARALERWGIPESRLPPGSVVEFRGNSLWRDYRSLVLASVAIGVVQALLIGGLLLERRRRRSAELSSRRHLATMAHVDRRSALGELAASLAHELGQPLAAIQANAQAAELMLAKGSADTEELRSILHDIRNDDLRAAEIIRGMRELLGKRELTKGPVDMNALIAESVAIVTPDAKSRGIQIGLSLSPDLPMVAGEPVYLQQVLLNLLLNGIAAVADEPRDRRRVDVQTVKGKSAVEVVVSDTGHGVPEEQRAAIFEPFVTTKERGLGVGLSVARSIVEAHDGTIEVDDSAASGATFRFRLPVL